MAVKASCDVIIGQSEDIDYSPFSSLLSLILNLIPDFVQNQDYEVLLCILNMFDDLNTIDDPFYEPFIPSILQICCTVNSFILLLISSYYKIIHSCILLVVLLEMLLHHSCRISLLSLHRMYISSSLSLIT